MSRHFILCLCLCVLVSNAALLRADDEPKSKAQSVKTDRLDFPSGGTLRLDNSVGELTVAGWDRPDIEITTIKSTKAMYGPQQRENATRDLDQVQIKTERRSNEVVVTTEFHRKGLTRHT